MEDIDQLHRDFRFLIEFQNCICYTVRATFFNRGGLNFRKVKNEYFYIFLIE